MSRPDRFTWLNRFEGNIVDIIPKLGLKNNQGVIIESVNEGIKHRFDCMGEYIYVIARRHTDNEFKYIMKEIDIAVPLYIGNIVEFDGNLIIKKIGDLYWDTVHLCKWWILKRKIQHFIYKLRIIHRWKIRRRFKRAE